METCSVTHARKKLTQLQSRFRLSQMNLPDLLAHASQPSGAPADASSFSTRLTANNFELDPLQQIPGKTNTGLKLTSQLHLERELVVHGKALLLVPSLPDFAIMLHANNSWSAHAVLVR